MFSRSHQWRGVHVYSVRYDPVASLRNQQHEGESRFVLCVEVYCEYLMDNQEDTNLCDLDDVADPTTSCRGSALRQIHDGSQGTIGNSNAPLLRHGAVCAKQKLATRTMIHRLRA